MSCSLLLEDYWTFKDRNKENLKYQLYGLPSFCSARLIFISLLLCILFFLRVPLFCIVLYVWFLFLCLYVYSLFIVRRCSVLCSRFDFYFAASMYLLPSHIVETETGSTHIYLSCNGLVQARIVLFQLFPWCLLRTCEVLHNLVEQDRDVKAHIFNKIYSIAIL